jgi:ankyrin repeat protein
MWAALTIERDSARYLMDHGADVNAKSTTGKTALMIAAEKGDSDTVRALLQHGARVNERDSKGKTALQHAREVPEESSYRSETIRVLQRSSAQ